MRHQFRHPNAGLTVLLEGERAAQQLTAVVNVRLPSRGIAGFTAMLVQYRLGIEKIHLARAPVHIEMDYGLRFWWEMRGPRFEIVNPAVSLGQIRVALHRHERAQTSVNLGAQQGGQSGAVNSI